MKILDKLILEIQIRLWLRNHTVQDLEKRLVEMGCTKITTRNSVIYSTPKGHGKIEITDTEIIINPQLEGK